MVKYGEIKDKEIVDKALMLKKLEAESEFYTNIVMATLAKRLNEIIQDDVRKEQEKLNEVIFSKIVEIARENNIKATDVKIVFNEQERIFEVHSKE